MNFLGKSLLALYALALLLPVANATDAEAKLLLKEAAQEFKDGDYVKAAETALDAEHMADSVELKATSVKKAVEYYRKANLYYREFSNIEKLLTSYPSQADYTTLVSRQYQLADAFYEGHRDPAYYPLRWIPWLKDEDRTVEAYSAVLKHAPFADDRAATAKLRTAVRIMESGGNMEYALGLLREIVKDYPNTKEAKYAQLRLGIALASLAEYGDGDGAYNREAIIVLNDFKKKYPEATEIEFVDKKILRTRDIQAERLMNIAAFYTKNNRQEAAQRYLTEVVRTYPDSLSADEAERLLTEMDKTYIPQPLTPAIEPRVQQYDSYPIPAYNGKLLIAPQNSDGKYLLPIRDLGITRAEDK